ncbi:MAG: GIY-YIG nuclease family protein [Patescibacteria group bacterium]|jgi:putative endonuclease
MSYFVYIVECCDGTYYVGLSNNVERRVKEHNGSAKGARYTKTRRPVTLKYTETYETFAQAIKREIEIKKWPRKRKARLWEEK